MNYGLPDILRLLGSLGLFLFGMKVMSDALMELAGDRMRKILASATSNRFFALLTGLFITTAIQSSSATTLMVVSFVNASLLTLSEAVGVIMGANIGTTVTAWLISILGFKVKISAIALPLVGLGFVLSLSKSDKRRQWGTFIIGFSILFIGLQFLKDSVPDIRNHPETLAFLTGYTTHGYFSILLFLVIGTVLTLIVQSSSATMAITLLMTYEGWIPFDMAAAMVLGENIGTTIAAFVANLNAKRAARAHLIFNVMGVIWMLLLFYPFIKMIGYVVIQLGSESPFITATAIPVALSLFHTSFNLLNSAILIGFTPKIVRTVQKLLPEKPEKEIEKRIIPVTWHLDDSQIDHPAIAIELAKTEMSRMIKILGRMLNACFHPFISDEPKQDEVYPQLSLVEGIDMREEKIDFLEEHVINYLFQISRKELSDFQAEEVFAMMSIANDMESIGDIIHRNIVPLMKKKQHLNESFSEEGKLELEAFHIKVLKQVSRLKVAFDVQKVKKVEKVIYKDKKYRDLELDYRQSHLKRIQKGKEESLATHEVHMELMEMLKQINVYIGNIAKTILNIKEVNN